MSAEKISKFTDRSDQCSKFLSLKQPILSDQSIPRYDSDNFSIVYDEDIGRNGVALNDISFGDVILIDEPVVVRNKTGKQFCANCLKKLDAKQIYTSPVDEEVKIEIFLR